VLADQFLAGVPYRKVRRSHRLVTHSELRVLSSKFRGSCVRRQFVFSVEGLEPSTRTSSAKGT
jgi:hypothetical protein